MLGALIISVFTNLLMAAGSVVPRAQNRIMRSRLKTAADGAELLAGLPLDELKDLDSRMHMWIDEEEMALFLTQDMSEEEAVKFIRRLRRLPRRGKLG